MEQLVINARQRLLEANGEENFTGGETETGQISGQDDEADMDSVHGVDARTEGTQKWTYMFYFVKHHQYELNPKMVYEIEQAQQEIQKKKEIKEEIENLKDTLRQMKIKEKQRIRKDNLKSGEEKRIMYLNHRIRNQRLTSKEKTTLLKLIKELETTRDKAIDAAAEASLQAKNRREDSIRCQISSRRKRRKSIEEYVLFHVNYVEQRNQQLLVSPQKVSHLYKHLEVLDRKIQKLEQKINYSKLRMDKAHAVIMNSEKLLDKMNAGYHQNCELLEYADALAKQNDLSALADLSNNELEMFFMQWTNNKYFKEDYKSMIIPSLEKLYFKYSEYGSNISKRTIRAV